MDKYYKFSRGDELENSHDNDLDTSIKFIVKTIFKLSYGEDHVYVDVGDDIIVFSGSTFGISLSKETVLDAVSLKDIIPDNFHSVKENDFSI